MGRARGTPEFLTVAEAADELDVSVEQVRRIIAAGELPALRIDTGRLRVERSRLAVSRTRRWQRW